MRIGTAGGTIGRSPDNALVLADPDRYVGRQHARIGFRDGAFFLTDTSTNGTFVNSAAERLSEGQEVELHDGDELSIGAYEIRVSLEVPQPQSVAPVAPLAGGRPEFESYARTPSGGAVPDIMDLVGGTTAETDPFPPQAAERKASAEPDHWLTAAPPEEGPRILESEPPKTPAAATEPDHTPDWNASYNPPETIPEDYDIWADASPPRPGAQDLPTGASESPPAPTLPDPASRSSTPESPPAPIVPDPASRRGGPQSPLAPTAPNPAPREGQPAPTPPASERMQKRRPTPTVDGETDAPRAFFAGLDAGELPADRQVQVELMRTTGQLLRVMTEGLMRVLMGRTSVKNELRLEMTQIRPMENNPFKFSIDPQDALTHLLFHPRPGYLPPLEAAREAFDDIQCHEMALVAGLRAALHALSKRMDPTELEHRFRGRSFIDNLMPMARKARCWDLFTETYQAIAADAADDFMNLFRDAFARAYEDQAARLRQVRPPDKPRS